jgi:acyl-CoA thioesterase
VGDIEVCGTVGSAFAEDTAVERVGDGRYVAELSDRWNLVPLPQGGVISAVAVQAMQDALGVPEQTLRLAHTTFAAQVAHGSLEIDVEVLRRGRSMSQVRAEVRNPGSTRGHLTIATFGGSRTGWDFTELARPDVPPPEESKPFRGTESAFWPETPFWSHSVEARAAIGHAPWEDFTATTAERAIWFRFDEPPAGADGVLDPLGLLVFADLMPGAAGQRIGRTDRPWFGPSADLTFHLLGECGTGWILGHNRARHAADGYASADMALWDGDRLVAYATQVHFFTFLD